MYWFGEFTEVLVFSEPLRWAVVVVFLLCQVGLGKRVLVMYCRRSFEEIVFSSNFSCNYRSHLGRVFDGFYSARRRIEVT